MQGTSQEMARMDYTGFRLWGCFMKYHRSLSVTFLAVASLMLCCLAAAGKEKKKVLLPADILEARTVLVVVDPEAGVAVDAPYANRKAQEDVEKAIMNWGRFTMAVDASDADLIVTVRKGSGKIAQPTVGGVPINNRPVIFEPSDSRVRIGGHTGNPTQGGDPTNSPPQSPSTRVEAGPAQDMFAVFRGKYGNGLDSPPVWRYSAKDALRSPSVPAVDEFKKLILEAEKQKAATP